MLYLNHPSPLVVELGTIPPTLTSKWYLRPRWSGTDGWFEYGSYLEVSLDISLECYGGLL